MCKDKVAPSKELHKIVRLIDRFIDGGGVDHGNAQYVNGLISGLTHKDNGANSVLHPLTAIHFSGGNSPHYTLQSGWLQTLCLRHMQVINDDGLQMMACSAVNATKKSEVKAAQDQAYGGKSIQSIDNIHFYPTGGSGTTAVPTLGTAIDLVRGALGKLGETGRVILAKDDAFLLTQPNGFRDYRLKETESPAWARLKTLLDSATMRTEPFIRRSDIERKTTAQILLDTLVRATG